MNQGKNQQQTKIIREIPAAKIVKERAKAAIKTVLTITTNQTITIAANLIIITVIVIIKGKKGKQQQSTKPAVPPRKFRELPDVLEYTEGMNVADIAKKFIVSQQKSLKIIYAWCHGQSKPSTG